MFTCHTGRRAKFRVAHPQLSHFFPFKAPIREVKCLLFFGVLRGPYTPLDLVVDGATLQSAASGEVFVAGSVGRRAVHNLRCVPEVGNLLAPLGASVVPQ